jgi:phosphate transport system permease protein
MIKKNKASSYVLDKLFTLVCYICMLFTISFLLMILFSLLKHGLTGFRLSIFIHSTQPPGTIGGGLANAIIGSLIMVAIALVISIPLGLATAIYLVEFSNKTRLARWLRLANDTLLTAPSILVGLFVYIILVLPFHRFSAIAGAISLVVIAFPMIVRTTEDVLYLVSPLLRESALALGIPRYKVINKVILRSAINGIITGVLLAIARIAGETAPLLFTSLSNQFFNLNIFNAMASLPVIIYRYALSPYQDWQNLAWSGALIITIFVCSMNLLARWMSRNKKRG